MEERTVDVNKPVRNPALTQAIAEMQAQNTVDRQNRMIDEMMQAHFLIPVQMNPAPDPPNAEGKTVLKEDTTIGFSMIEDADGRLFFLAFTDWEELRKWKTQDNQKTVIFSFDDYAALLSEEHTTGAGFVINPFGGNVIIPREMVLALKAEKDRRAAGGVVEQVIEKETTVQLGEPRIYPQAMVEAIKERLKSLKQVETAWLQLMVKEGEQSWLVVLEFSGDRRRVFDEVAQAARPYLDGMYLDMVPLDTTFGDAVAHTKPFYRRKRFGFF